MNATPEQQAALIAAGVPAALVGLAEFVEPDGSPVAVCDPECGTTRWMPDTRTWAHCAVMGRGYGASDTYWRNSVACYNCRAILGVLPGGGPYRIRHSRIVEEFGKVRDLLHDMETTDVTIAIQEREEARDQARASLAALEQAQADVSRLRGELTRTQAERDRFCEVLTNIGDNCGPDPVWVARVVLNRWFREAAALAATEKAGGEDE